MATSSPFVYHECFKEHTLQRTPAALKIGEEGNSNLLLIVRLLSGAIKLEHTKSEKKINVTQNYFSSDFENYKQHWRIKFPALFIEDYDANKFAAYITSTKNKNFAFFKHLLCELSYFIYYEHKGQHLSAFLFLYRVLEHISYTFPLIYASKTDDFLRTFSFLKSVMNGDKKAGELGFLKKFVGTIYPDGDPMRDLTVDFDISLRGEEQQKIYKLLERLAGDNAIAETTNEPSTLSIKYTEVGSFLVTLRNRYFHYMNGEHKNLDSIDLVDVDETFGLVNKHFMYWISTLLLAVLEQTIADFELNNGSET